MNNRRDIASFRWQNDALNCSHDYLLPTVFVEIARGAAARVFELGCGNGSVANQLAYQGGEVVGVGPSVEGIAQAKASFPHVQLADGSAYDDLAAAYGVFPVVTSLEVVEHVYAPQKYAATLFSLLDSGGTAIVSTPYHGYWKNLALALTDKLDAHFKALWDHGQVKFWSMRTLAQLLHEAGFADLRFLRVGRIPLFARAMVVVARKP